MWEIITKEPAGGLGQPGSGRLEEVERPREATGLGSWVLWELGPEGSYGHPGMIQVGQE